MVGVKRVTASMHNEIEQKIKEVLQHRVKALQRKGTVVHLITGGDQVNIAL